MTVYARKDYLPEPGEVVEDNLLIREDKNPNSHGVHAMFGDLPWSAGNGHDLVLVWGDNADCTSFGNAKVIQLASFDMPQERHADVLIPISTTFERSGSFTNFEGKVNRFSKVFEKPGLVQHAGDVFGRLGA